MSRLPLELELERAALFDLPFTPPHEGDVMPNGERRKCVKCGGQLRSLTGPDTCWNCRTGKKSQPKALADADAELLERVEASSARKKTPPTPEPAEVEPAAATSEPTYQEQFFRLASALDLQPEEMIEDFCRNWVLATRARALGKEVTVVEEGPSVELEAPSRE